MKLIFGQGPSLGLRLFFAILLSVSLMLADNRLDSFTFVRSSLNNIAAPIQYVASFPRQMFDNIYKYVDSHYSLVQENERLQSELLQLKSELLVLDDYKHDNIRLRELLKSPYIRDETKMIAEVMAVNSSTYRKRLLINKGSADGVYEGQPVINEKGIVGQVTNVARHYSHVLLLTDVDSAIPVQVLEKDIRVIASGRDQSQNLYLENIPNGTNIQPGDKLVSSGLGGVYPEGYPVGVVSHVDGESTASFSNISITPAVDFDRLRYLLLVWSNDEKKLINEEESALIEDEMSANDSAIEAQEQASGEEQTTAENSDETNAEENAEQTSTEMPEEDALTQGETQDGQQGDETINE